MTDGEVTPNPARAAEAAEQSSEVPSVSPSSLAVGLGYFSVALGLAELAAPRVIARTIGAVPDPTTCRVLRGFGIREIATGAAILAQPDRPVWLWSRVGGDLLDLSSLRAARQTATSDRTHRTVATLAVLGVTALDVLCAIQLSRRGEAIQPGDGDSDGRWRTIYKNTPRATT